MEGTGGTGGIELASGGRGPPEVDGRGATAAVVTEDRVREEYERARGLPSVSGIVGKVGDTGEPKGVSLREGDVLIFWDPVGLKIFPRTDQRRRRLSGRLEMLRLREERASGRDDVAGNPSSPVEDA